MTLDHLHTLIGLLKYKQLGAFRSAIIPFERPNRVEYNILYYGTGHAYRIFYYTTSTGTFFDEISISPRAPHGTRTWIFIMKTYFHAGAVPMYSISVRKVGIGDRYRIDIHRRYTDET